MLGMFSLTLIVATACTGQPSGDVRQPSGGAGTKSSAAIAQPLSVDSARQQLERYLDLAIAGRRLKVGAYASVREDSICGPALNFMRALWVADFRVLPGGRTIGDTVVIQSILTSVADQRESLAHASKYVATLGAREDTATWTLVRSLAGNPNWRVCGDTREGFDVIAIGPKEIGWSPSGASRVRALGLVDSVRKARGLPLAR
ncbi:hypothetical protein EBR44_08755 [bacterium]|jgi:hypothetical protein|nr:hypothetical protein [bacterium]